MKKGKIALIIIVLAVVGFFVVRQVLNIRDLMQGMELVTIEARDITGTISGSGTIRANQTATLEWQLSGSVEQVMVNPGDKIAAGTVLAALNETSLPASIILAQADLVAAQQELDNLLNSKSRQAQALKAVDDAEKVLEDALNPELDQANKQAALAEAEKSLDSTQLQLDILVKPVPQFAIDQAYANLQLAEKKLTDIREDVEKIERKLAKDPSTYLPWESVSRYNQMLQGLQVQFTRQQVAYNDSLQRYNNMLTPPDPIDVAAAQTDRDAARALFNQAERDFQRSLKGAAPGEIALLEAILADARRELDRLKDGPNEEEILNAETRIAAAQASINTIRIEAPFNATVTQVLTQDDDRVSSGTAAIRLDDISTLYVDIQVSEVDINQVIPGQGVILTMDAIFAKEYRGKVVEVGLIGLDVAGTVYYEVTVELLDNDDDIKPGMSASAHVQVQELVDVLTVPNRSVRIVDGEHVVYVASPQGLPEPVTIVLGISSEEYTQIFSEELKEGDSIYLTPPSLFFAEAGPGQGRPPFMNR